MLEAILIGIAGIFVLSFGTVLWGAIFYLPVRSAELRAKEAWPEVADTFHKEFERQYAILRHEPDPLPVMAIFEAGKFREAEIWVSDSKAHFLIHGTRITVPIESMDTPRSVAAKLADAERLQRVRTARS